jgi:ABC-type branched-subunit amino acid transport system substrate-binding protein
MPNNFSVTPAEDGGAPIAPFNYYKGKFPEEIKAVGTLYGDVPASKAAHDAYLRVGEQVGWKILYNRGYAATETDFTADVVRMRQSGVKIVFLAASEPKTLARITKAMKQQSFDVPIITQAIGYEKQLITLGGDSVEGMYTTILYTMFQGEDSAAMPEVKLMNQWLQKVKPGYSPDVYALLAWASGRLLFTAMQKAGPRATRAQVIDAVRRLGPFDTFGLMAPANPGAKTPATCIVVVQLRHGHYERVDTPPTGFRCDLGGYSSPR